MKQLIIILCTLFTIAAGAQTRSERVDQIRAKKVAYIKQQLNLTPEEEKAFLPVYGEYEKARWEIMKRTRENQRAIKSGTATNYAEMAEQLINNDVAMSQLAKTYHERFKKILPPEKLLKYYLADSEFKDVLLKDIKRQAQEGKK